MDTATLTGDSAEFLESVEDSMDSLLDEAFEVVADKGPEHLQAWADGVRDSSPYVLAPAPVQFNYTVELHHLAFQVAFRAVCSYLNIEGFEPQPTDLAWVILTGKYQEPQESRGPVDMVRAVFRGYA